MRAINPCPQSCLAVSAPAEQTRGVDMGRHRRCQLEIICDILQICLKSENKTKIVYHANLNFHRTKEYLDVLLRLGYVDEKTNGSGIILYKTTGDGRIFLENFVGAQDMFGNSLSKTS